MIRPVIAVYTRNVSDDQAPQFDTVHNALGYADLFRFIIEKGGTPICVYDAKQNYLGNGNFRQNWAAVLKNDKIIYEKNNSEIKIDLLYDKNHFPFSDLKKINPDIITRICNDKYLTYLFAPDMHAQSFLINDASQLETLRLGHNTQRVVLKELEGYGGNKVFVGALGEYRTALKFPLLFQEFVDTSAGIDGLAKGVHDLRVGIFNGKVIHGLLRWPSQKNELRTNLHLGGKTRALFVNEIPDAVVDMTRKLDRRFQTDVPRFFSADFGFDGKDWRLFELNSMPGIWSKPIFGEANDEFLELLADNLVKSANS